MLNKKILRNLNAIVSVPIYNFLRMDFMEYVLNWVLKVCTYGEVSSKKKLMEGVSKL